MASGRISPSAVRARVFQSRGVRQTARFLSRSSMGKWGISTPSVAGAVHAWLSEPSQEGLISHAGRADEEEPSQALRCHLSERDAIDRPLSTVARGLWCSATEVLQILAGDSLSCQAGIGEHGSGARDGRDVPGTPGPRAQTSATMTQRWYHLEPIS